jgi:type I restriction enzyme S subunit
MREDWIEIQLGEILKVSSGLGLTLKKMSGEGHPVYGGNGITGYHSAYLYEDEKLIIGRVGARCGVTHITKRKSWVTDNALVVQFKLPCFFLKFMRLKLQFENLNKLSNSTAQPVISGSKIYSYSVKLPPLPEQRAIVSKIEQLFSELDHAIANLQAAKEKLEIYRQAVLKKAFEGGFTESGLWEPKKLGDIIKISSGNGLTKANRNDEGQCLVYGGNGVTGRHDDFMFEDQQLIIGRVGVHCGNTHITEPKCWVTDNAFVVNFDKKEIILKCLYYLILSLRLNQYASSTAQPVISGGKVYPVEFLFPPREIQVNLVDEIESRLSVCDNILDNIEEGLKKSEALRQSILKQAFEGKLLSEEELEACKKEVDWEPAEQLLERIKTEKEV